MGYRVLQPGKPSPCPPAASPGGGNRVSLPRASNTPRWGPSARACAGLRGARPGPSGDHRPDTGEGMRAVRAVLPEGCRAQRLTWAALQGGEGRQPPSAASPLLPPRRPGPVRPAALTPAAPRRAGTAPSPQPSFLRRQKPDTGSAPRSPCASGAVSGAPAAARACRGPDRRPARSCPPAPCHVSRGAGPHACSPSASSSCAPKRPAWAGPRRPAAPRSPTAGKVSGAGRDGTGVGPAGAARLWGAARAGVGQPGRADPRWCPGHAAPHPGLSAPAAPSCGSWAVIEFVSVGMNLLLNPAFCKSSPLTVSSLKARIVLCY